jgi:hypothetical protein
MKIVVLLPLICCMLAVLLIAETNPKRRMFLRLAMGVVGLILLITIIRAYWLN